MTTKIRTAGSALGIALACGLLFPIGAMATAEPPDKVAAEPAPAATSEAPAVEATDAKEKSSSTADHSKFKELEGPFATGPDVTKACLECHTEAAKQIMHTKHWTWEYTNPKTGQKLGKKNVINNFCTSIQSNQTFCTACHIGYGWSDSSFDFDRETNVDCVVCHDTTGGYKKLPGLSGHPAYKSMEFPPHSGKFVAPVDLVKVAQNVGKTSRQSCGACHFRGGGGDAVKHGDLDSSLENPGRYLDVHMDAKGLNFSCSKCHTTDAHEVSGSRYDMTAADSGGVLKRGSADERNPTTCQACHSNEPHENVKFAAKLNEHTKKVACQTCHIPAYARGPLHTKMSWDWSTAGKLDEQGHRIQTKDSVGKVIYDSKKGDFTYDRYVTPEYQWFNGEINFTLFGDKVSENEVVKINEFMGSPDDPNSRIWPIRKFRGKQMYDKGLETLAIMHTAGDDDAAFWNTYNWDKAMEWGMREVGSKYSGELGFVETEMSWPITHMVAPKEDSLKCRACHTSTGGRLAGITGVYIPARDGTPTLDKIGLTLALLALIGVLIHGGIRVIMSKKEG